MTRIEIKFVQSENGVVISMDSYKGLLATDQEISVNNTFYDLIDQHIKQNSSPVSQKSGIIDDVLS